jgi:hypothetical protein
MRVGGHLHSQATLLFGAAVPSSECTGAGTYGNEPPGSIKNDFLTTRVSVSIWRRNLHLTWDRLFIIRFINFLFTFPVFAVQVTQVGYYWYLHYFLSVRRNVIVRFGRSSLQKYNVPSASKKTLKNNIALYTIRSETAGKHNDLWQLTFPKTNKQTKSGIQACLLFKNCIANALKHSGNYMYHLPQRSVTLHSAPTVTAWVSYNRHN